jgi:hypothetical protein
MAGHVLDLRGCTPEPLGNYLKGLGVFRLIAEQADPQVRAWWKDGVLWLYSRWNKEEIQAFFFKGIGEKNQFIYSPTPFSPRGVDVLVSTRTGTRKPRPGYRNCERSRNPAVGSALPISW